MDNHDLILRVSKHRLAEGKVPSGQAALWDAAYLKKEGLSRAQRENLAFYLSSLSREILAALDAERVEQFREEAKASAERARRRGVSSETKRAADSRRPLSLEEVLSL